MPEISQLSEKSSATATDYVVVNHSGSIKRLKLSDLKEFVYPYIAEGVLIADGDFNSAQSGTITIPSTYTSTNGCYLWVQSFYAGAGCEEVKFSAKWKSGNPYGNVTRMAWLEGGCTNGFHGANDIYDMSPAFAQVLRQPGTTYKTKTATNHEQNAGSSGSLGAATYSIAIIFPYGCISHFYTTWIRSVGYGGKLDNPAYMYDYKIWKFEGFDFGNPYTVTEAQIPTIMSTIPNSLNSKTVDYVFTTSYKLTPNDSDIEAVYE